MTTTTCLATPDRHEPSCMRCAFCGLFWDVAEEPPPCPAARFNDEPSLRVAALNAKLRLEKLTVRPSRATTTKRWLPGSGMFRIWVADNGDPRNERAPA